MDSIKKNARAIVREKRTRLRNELKELKGTEKRTDRFAAFLETMPNKIKKRSHVDFSLFGTYLYATIRPMYKRFTDNDTLLITSWCADLSDKWTFSKNVSSSDGTWNHRVHRWIGNTHFDVQFDTTSNIDGCELVEIEETITQKRYELKC